LVQKAYKDRVIALEPQLALYVIAVLNGSNVILPDGKIAPLRFSFRGNDGGVTAAFEIDLDDGTSRIISAPLFTTKLPSENLYNPILAPKLVEGANKRRGLADIPVELRPDGRLDIMSGLDDLLDELSNES
jgi:hypothetical protein